MEFAAKKLLILVATTPSVSTFAALDLSLVTLTLFASSALMSSSLSDLSIGKNISVPFLALLPGRLMYSFSATPSGPFGQPERPTAIDVTVVGAVATSNGTNKTDHVPAASEPAGHAEIAARNKHKDFLDKVIKGAKRLPGKTAPRLGPSLTSEVVFVIGDTHL